MFSNLAKLVLLFVPCVIGLSVSTQTCTDLIKNLKLPSDVTIIFTTPYPDNSTIVDPTDLSFPTPAVDLPALCRVYANISTSPTSFTRFEVWLPLNTWNVRYLTIGNGGGAGGINYQGMGVGIRKGFSVMSTDAGHNSTVFDGTWEGDGPEVTIDFGWRAVHLSTVYAKEITTQFYGCNFTHAYYTGCSSGGKQGLKSIQRFPDDFDGVLVGAPAYQWNYLNAYSIHVNEYQTDNTSAGWISPVQIAFLYEQVIKFCDPLDGVTDGVIANPRVCTFRPETVLCKNFPANTTGCFTGPQVVNLENIYRDYVESNSTYIFPAFEKGSEAFWTTFGLSGTLTSLQPLYYALQVLNVSADAFDPYSLNLTVIQLAQEINPGDIIADDSDLSPYFSRNGKVIHYHGWADPLIASRTSIDYYNQVERTLETDFSDNYRLFMVPGMGHCGLGPGPWNFNSDPEGATLDQTAGLVDQLIAWVENGIAPDTILGTKYVNDTGPLGVEFQRPICPYPQTAVFTGNGNWTQPQNWVCKLE